MAESQHVARYQAVEPSRSPVEAWCSVRLLRPFHVYLTRAGFDSAGNLAKVGITQQSFDVRDLRLPHQSMANMLQRAVDMSGDFALGVHAAEHVQTGDFDVLEYAAGTCKTLGQSMRCAARYMVLMHDGAVVELDESRGMASLRYGLIDGLWEPSAGTEFALTSLLLYGRRFTGMNLRPVAVDFAFPKPPDTSEHERVFQCPVRFDQEDTMLWFPAEALELPQAQADSGLHHILVRHAEHMLEAVGTRDRFTDRVRKLVASELCGGNPGVDHVAELLAVSTRTLHRRLKEEGTTFRRVVDDLRRSLAMRYLAGNWYSIAEVSFLLGFSHVNAFHKAFRRWTDTTPAQYREEHSE